jgi:hypothetical protein
MLLIAMSNEPCRIVTRGENLTSFLARRVNGIIASDFLSAIGYRPVGYAISGLKSHCKEKP